jgi:hypothetical protein
MANKGNGIFLVYTDIDPKHEEEFDAWYNTEHLPDLLKLPGFLSAARYVAVKSGPRHLAAYELASVEAFKSPEFQRYRANPSPWSRRMSPTVIGKNFTRVVGAQIFPATLEMADRAGARRAMRLLFWGLRPHDSVSILSENTLGQRAVAWRGATVVPSN